MSTIRIALLAYLLVGASIASGQSGQSEGINDSYKTARLNVQEWVQRFEVEGREAFDLRNEVVAALALKPGQVVADIGAGTGLFEPLLAEAVGPGGIVYAVDIAPRFIEHITKRAAEAGLRQVRPVLGTERSTKLPADAVDVIFTSDAYHHFVHYRSMLASMKRALKPGGQLIVLDFDIESGQLSDQMVTHVGGTKERFRRQIEAAGFEFVADATLPQMRSSFMYRFRKGDR